MFNRKNTTTIKADKIHEDDFSCRIQVEVDSTLEDLVNSFDAITLAVINTIEKAEIKHDRDLAIAKIFASFEKNMRDFIKNNGG